MKVHEGLKKEDDKVRSFRSAYGNQQAATISISSKINIKL